jgi:hypothetical protein
MKFPAHTALAAEITGFRLRLGIAGKSGFWSTLITDEYDGGGTLGRGGSGVSSDGADGKTSVDDDGDLTTTVVGRRSSFWPIVIVVVLLRTVRPIDRSLSIRDCSLICINLNWFSVSRSIRASCSSRR